MSTTTKIARNTACSLGLRRPTNYEHPQCRCTIGQHRSQEYKPPALRCLAIMGANTKNILSLSRNSSWHISYVGNRSRDGVICQQTVIPRHIPFYMMVCQIPKSHNPLIHVQPHLPWHHVNTSIFHPKVTNCS